MQLFHTIHESSEFVHAPYVYQTAVDGMLEDRGEEQSLQ